MKQFAMMDAETARPWDPHIAAIYYAQMLQHGKPPYQALCTCATHWLDRIWTILREDRPYELRDVDDTPVSVERAREIIASRSTVPKEVRPRQNQKTRRSRAEHRAEKQQQGKVAPAS